MKLLFEGYRYEYSDLQGMLDCSYFEVDNDGKAFISYVGYYYSPEIGDAIMIMPKVFLYDGGKAFGLIEPSRLLHFTGDEVLKEGGRRKIIFELATWIFRVIQCFCKKHPGSIIPRSEQLCPVIASQGSLSTMELGIVLSLLRFYKDNQGLFTSIAKNSHSGFGKVSWAKTIATTSPILQGGQPFYVNLVTKSRQRNYDEELLIIFYSLLKHLEGKYGFNIALGQNYSLMTGRGFELFAQGAMRRLKAIRRNYFSDKMVALWELLYCYFERTETVKSSGCMLREYLLVRDFNIVFEDMVDELIGDRDIPRYLKEQKDGKQLDHIYLYRSLIEDDIYFIGDSKYYRPDNSVRGVSLAKQYTYAKNVIQYNIDMFNRGVLGDNIRYRDELTEGYNISPNFFITAYVDRCFDFGRNGLTEADGMKGHNCHFLNRLFDRDTLFLQAYNINFLFVLSAYTSRTASVRSSFREKARSLFRERLIEYFNEKFSFYLILPLGSVDDFVNKHFKLLVGKIYRPSSMGGSLVMALEKGVDFEDENREIIRRINGECELRDYRLS